MLAVEPYGYAACPVYVTLNRRVSDHSGFQGGKYGNVLGDKRITRSEIKSLLSVQSMEFRHSAPRQYPALYGRLEAGKHISSIRRPLSSAKRTILSLIGTD